MRGQHIMTTSIEPSEDPLGSGAISLTRSPPLNPARKAPSSSQLPEPTPVPNPHSTVLAAESTDQLPESHAVNAAPVIPPASTRKSRLLRHQFVSPRVLPEQQLLQRLLFYLLNQQVMSPVYQQQQTLLGLHNLQPRLPSVIQHLVNLPKTWQPQLQLAYTQMKSGKRGMQ